VTETAKTTTITYFPKVAKYEAACQFCGDATQFALSKNRDGKWVTTCQTCFGDKQGVVPISYNGKRFLEASSAGNGCKGTSTVFRCVKCEAEVAYVKSNKGKWYLADVYESRANFETGAEKRWIANWQAHFANCDNNAERRATLADAMQAERAKADRVAATKAWIAENPVPLNADETAAWHQAFSDWKAKQFDNQ
jgi:hypothetical protein